MTRPMLQAALNGGRDIPEIPRTPEEIAAEARAAVDAGAESLHFHPYEDGRQTLAAAPCADAIRAVRDACPGVEISLSTAAWIAPDPDRRLELVGAWTELPDLVSANFGEEGTLELCELLGERGVGIEAGLFSVDDARAFVGSGFAPRCERVLVEPHDEDADDAVAHAGAIEAVLADAGVELHQIHHGDGVASWAVNRRAVERGHGIRTGLEDTPVLPDGREAEGNGELLAAGASLLA